MHVSVSLHATSLRKVLRYHVVSCLYLPSAQGHQLCLLYAPVFEGRLCYLPIRPRRMRAEKQSQKETQPRTLYCYKKTMARHDRPQSHYHYTMLIEGGATQDISAIENDLDSPEEDAEEPRTGKKILSRYHVWSSFHHINVLIKEATRVPLPSISSPFYSPLFTALYPNYGLPTLTPPLSSLPTFTLTSE